MISSDINSENMNTKLEYRIWKKEYDKISDMPIKSQAYTAKRLINSNVKTNDSEEREEYRTCLEILKAFILNVAFVDVKQTVPIKKIG